MYNLKKTCKLTSLCFGWKTFFFFVVCVCVCNDLCTCKCVWVCTVMSMIVNTEHFMQLFIDQSKVHGCYIEKPCRIQSVVQKESERWILEIVRFSDALYEYTFCLFVFQLLQPFANTAVALNTLNHMVYYRWGWQYEYIVDDFACITWFGDCYLSYSLLRGFSNNEFCLVICLVY